MEISKLNKSALSQLKDAVESPSLRLAREAADSSLFRTVTANIDSPFAQLVRESSDNSILRDAMRHDNTLARLVEEATKQTRLFDSATLDAFESSRRMFDDIIKQSVNSGAFSKFIDETSAATRDISEQMRVAFASFDRTQLPKISDVRFAATQLAEQFRSQHDSLAKLFAGDDFSRQMTKFAEQVARSFGTRDMDLARALRESLGSIRTQLDEARQFEMNTAVHADSVDATDSLIAQVVRADAELTTSEHQAQTEWFAQLPTWLQICLLLFVIPLIGAFLDAAAEEARQRIFHTADKTEQHQIVYNIQNVFGVDAVAPIRCVRASTLTVRKNPNKGAAAIGKLSRGQFVEVLDRRNGYSLVRYRLDSQQPALVEGWVATSYLVAFVC